MIKKEFVPYNESLELKELGFDEPCFGYYDNQIKELDTISSEVCERLCKHGTHTKAPTYSQAFRWFRDKGFLISFSSHDKDTHEFYIKWISTKSILSNEYKTYEEAELECLKKLIEIAKQK